MASPSTLWHQLEVQFLETLLELFTSRTRTGIVLRGPAALKIREDCFLEPDLFVIPPGGESQLHEFYCDPPVLLVVEVLSHSTRHHDLTRKAAVYREAGVAEVWFVDDRDQAVIIHRRTNEAYVVERVESGPIRSVAVDGFWVEVSWLWAKPRPDLTACFAAILAGPPA